MKKIAIFASGTGSNTHKIIEYFKLNSNISVNLVVSNKQDAPVLNIAEQYGIPTLMVDRQQFYHSEKILYELQEREIDFIVLAGFLWLIPSYLVTAFQKKMINIHPALLPKFGGKGMYGMKVHEAVHAAKEKESGITIHYVNEKYDEGDIIFQKSFEIKETDTPQSIAGKIHELEHKYFPEVIERLVSNL